MKKFIIILSLVLFIVSNCKKREDNPSEVEEKQPDVAIASSNQEDIAFNYYSDTGELPEKIHLFVAAKDGLLFRKEPNLKGTVISKIPYGTKLTVSSTEGGDMEEIGAVYGRWKKAEFEGKSGYVFDAFLSVVNKKYISENLLKIIECNTYTNVPMGGPPVYTFYLLKNGKFVSLMYGEHIAFTGLDGEGEFGTFEETKESITFNRKEGSVTYFAYLGKWLDSESREKYRKEPRILERFERELNNFTGQTEEFLFMCSLVKGKNV